MSPPAAFTPPPQRKSPTEAPAPKVVEPLSLTRRRRRAAGKAGSIGTYVPPAHSTPYSDDRNHRVGAKGQLDTDRHLRSETELLEDTGHGAKTVLETPAGRSYPVLQGRHGIGTRAGRCQNAIDEV